MTDRIFYRGMAFFARHGVYPEERQLGQRFEVDVDCRLDLTPWSHDDDFGKALSYREIYDLVRETAEGEPVNLIEALAERIADVLLRRFPVLDSVRIEVRKPGAAIPGVFETVGVEIERTRGDAPA